MSELTLTIIRLGLLVLLWVFVFSIAGVLRGDVYGTRVVSRTPRKQQPARRPAAPPAPAAPAREQKARRAGRNEPTGLTVTAGPLRGTSLSLKESGTLIGRNPECALILDDDFVSGRHARIFRGQEGWLVEDLGSTNGTYLGQQKLTSPTAVGVGSVLRVGQTVVELRK